MGISKGLALDGAGTGHQLVAIKHTLVLVVGHQQGQHLLGNLLLWVQNCLVLLAHLTSRATIQGDSLTDLSTLRGSHDLNLSVLSIRGTHYHTLRHNISEFTRLQVGIHYAETFSHLLDGNELLKT